MADVHTVRMRWFGPEFDSGDLDQIAVVADYHNHVAKLRAKVASSIQELTRTNLHDGLVRAWELEGDTFGWSLVVGDLQVGYELVAIDYLDASLH